MRTFNNDRALLDFLVGVLRSMLDPFLPVSLALSRSIVGLQRQRAEYPTRPLAFSERWVVRWRS